MSILKENWYLPSEAGKGIGLNKEELEQINEKLIEAQRRMRFNLNI